MPIVAVAVTSVKTAITKTTPADQPLLWQQLIASDLGSLTTAINAGARAAETQKINNESNYANRLALETIGIPYVDAGTAIAAAFFQGLKGVNAIQNGNTAGGIADIAGGIFSVVGGKVLKGIGKLGGKAVAPVVRAIAGDSGPVIGKSSSYVTDVRTAPMNYHPVTKGQIAQQAAYDYQRSVTGLYEFEVSGGGTKVWADGISGTELVDTKYVTNPASSPYTGTAPSFVNQSTVDEIQRYGKVISDPQTPFTSLRIVTNNQAAVDYFSGLLKDFRIPGHVEYHP